VTRAAPSDKNSTPYSVGYCIVEAEQVEADIDPLKREGCMSSWGGGETTDKKPIQRKLVIKNNVNIAFKYSFRQPPALVFPDVMVWMSMNLANSRFGPECGFTSGYPGRRPGIFSFHRSCLKRAQIDASSPSFAFFRIVIRSSQL
jgi:hypothetical protein